MNELPLELLLDGNVLDMLMWKAAVVQMRKMENKLHNLRWTNKYSELSLRSSHREKKIIRDLNLIYTGLVKNHISM